MRDHVWVPTHMGLTTNFWASSINYNINDITSIFVYFQMPGNHHFNTGITSYFILIHLEFIPLTRRVTVLQENFVSASCHTSKSWLSQYLLGTLCLPSIYQFPFKKTKFCPNWVFFGIFFSKHPFMKFGHFVCKVKNLLIDIPKFLKRTQRVKTCTNTAI